MTHSYTLSISSHCNLVAEANTFYDRVHLELYNAALLTKCYTQDALPAYIDSEINHSRHFIKMKFVNKRIKFIDLPSILYSKTLLFCYKFNKPIYSILLILTNEFLNLILKSLPLILE